MVDALSTDTILTAFIALVTLAGVVGSIVIARIGQKQDQVLATAEADRAERAQGASEASAARAEAAAALNIDALTRIADVLEQSISSALERSAQAAVQRQERPASGSSDDMPFANPARVKWSLGHHKGDTYILENIGDATAYNVSVSAAESMLLPRKLPSDAQLEPGEALTFMAARTMGTVDSTITVKWSPTEDLAEEGTWRYPLPPRPPR